MLTCAASRSLLASASRVAEPLADCRTQKLRTVALSIRYDAKVGPVLEADPVVAERREAKRQRYDATSWGLRGRTHG